MKKITIIITILLMSTTLFGALPPKVQKQKDLIMMKKNLYLQNNSPIVLKALVIKKVEVRPDVDKASHKSYNREVILTIVVEDIVRNKNKITINDSIQIKYSVFMPNYMPGPKVYTVKVPNENETYIFYLDDNLYLSARNYSIDTLDNKLRDEALENKENFIEDVDFKLLQI